MPKLLVEIEWDYPNERHWLNASNVQLALASYCKNTRFNVAELVVENESTQHGARLSVDTVLEETGKELMAHL